MNSKTQGCHLAHQAHMKLIDYFLKNTEGRNFAVEEFLSEENQIGFNWEEGTTASNAHRKLVKQLAQAQVLWVEPFMTEIIDSGANQLFELGLETGQWPTISPDEMTIFDNNLLVISGGVSFDNLLGGNVRWFTRGIGYTGFPDDNNMSFPLLDVNFSGSPTGAPIALTAWNFDEQMELATEDDKKIYENKYHPSWIVKKENALVRCGIRSLLDYINRKGRNQLGEIPIPNRTLKNTNRKIGKSGFNSSLWKPTIKIIDLPRKPYNPSASAESGRRLTCQHIVEQHIRQQHYASLGPAYLDDEKTIWNPKSHKAILVPSYIKGPEDAPFKEYSDVVYAVIAGMEEIRRSA